MTQDQIRSRLITRMKKKGLRPKDVQQKTGLDRVTVWRFLKGGSCRGGTLDLFQKV